MTAPNKPDKPDKPDGPNKPVGPVRQDNAAYDGGTQNIAQGGNVYNLNVYPSAATEPAAEQTGPAPSGPRAGALKGRRLALAVGGAVAVIAAPATIVALQYGQLRTENVDNARSAPADAPSSPAASSPSASAAASPSPSAAPASPSAGGAGQPAAVAAAPPTASAAPTPRSATLTSAYPSKDVACATRWFPTGDPRVEFQPCTQAASGTGGAQFGVKVRNTGTVQQVVTVLVKGYIRAVPKDCPSHPGTWREIVINAGQTWYSGLAQCSLGNEVKGNRVQSGAWVAFGSVSDTELVNTTLHYSQGFDIGTDGTVLPAT
ncbi:hypothetical protein AB0I68_25150 [Streptomyces sp. NPDC050448]|uniref:hypothetical protein n=1 Tax=Streptomyces sp. NPDC050448 TaxID=3155404 RepID=UPI00343E6DD5